MAEYIHTQSGARVSVADDKELGFGFVPVGEHESDELSDAPDQSWKVTDLKAYADEQGIDLGEATKKDDILAVIEAAGDYSDNDDAGDPDDE